MADSITMGEISTITSSSLMPSVAMDTDTMTTSAPLIPEYVFRIIIPCASGLGGLLIVFWVIACCRQIRKHCGRRGMSNLDSMATTCRRSMFISQDEDLFSASADFTISPKIFWEELKLDELILDEQMKDRMRRFLIPRNKLSIHKLIGEGQYAQVHFGTLISASFSCEQKVAVKIMKEHWTDQARNLIGEGMLTAEFNHPNVLTIVGISLEYINTKQIRPLVVMPFLENGDLNNFLKNVRLANNQELALHWRVEMMVQIASGMEYISDKKIVHRDLATRNCMLDDDYMVRVADFGLARQIINTDFYKMRIRHSISCSLPVKWVAIEGLNDSIFTTKSDVWSFGVTMWEIVTHAKIPYPGLENYKVLAHLESGHRLRQPDGCPTSLYKLMYACWHADPRMRPSFAFLRESLEKLKETIISAPAGTWSASLIRQQQGAMVQQNNPLYHSCWV